MEPELCYIGLKVIASHDLVYNDHNYYTIMHAVWHFRCSCYIYLNISFSRAGECHVKDNKGMVPDTVAMVSDFELLGEGLVKKAYPLILQLFMITRLTFFT